jgi:THO complex subunit 4
MSAGKLDQSLDDILKTSRTSARGGRRGARRSGAGRPAAKPAPVGGVQKAQKGAKPTKAVPTGPASFTGSGESKILISNLVCTSPISL